MASERSRTYGGLPAETGTQLTLRSLQGLRSAFLKTGSSRLATIFAIERDGARNGSGSADARSTAKRNE
jgi:hypothetical protein